MAATNSDEPFTWGRWLQARLSERGWNQADLIRASNGDLDSPRVSKWLAGKQSPTLPGIRAACKALGVPAVEGMIAAGHLQPDDVGATIVDRLDPAALTNHELLAELGRRLPPDHRDGADVTPLRPRLRPDTVGEEWAARRRPPQK